MANPTGVNLGGDNPNKIPLVGPAFDGVLLPSDTSDVIPSGVSTSTQLTHELCPSIPVVSTIIDTVAETHMVIVMTRQGGMSILHRSLSIEEQAQQVEIMKRSEADMVSGPVACSPDDTIAEVDTECTRCRISSLPAVGKDGKLIGICTNRDVRFEINLDRKVSGIVTSIPLVVTEQGASDDAALSLLCTHRVGKLSIVDDGGRLTGLIAVKDLVKKGQYPGTSKDSSGRLLVGTGIGTDEDSWKCAYTLTDAGVDVLTVGAAHVHNSGALEMVSHVKREFGGNIRIIGGNLTIRDTVQAMIDASVNAIKADIGPNSVCTTHVIASADAPWVTTIIEASVATKKTGASIIANSGMRLSGDIAKALAAGTPSVMFSLMLAGIVETPGEIIFVNGKQYEMYRGMGSLDTVQGRGLTGGRRSHSEDHYFQVDVKNEGKPVPKGVKGRIPLRGNIDSIVHQLVGGLRVAMSYIGSAAVERLHDAQLTQITAAGLRESHPHDIRVTVETPSYYQR